MMEQPVHTTLTKNICYHCGEPFVDEIIEFQEKEFCCQGCKNVYELLNDHELSNYYTCDVNPGISPSNQNFDYLNKPAFRDKLIQFSNQEVSKVSFNLPSIHCRSCLYILENLHKLNPGIIKTQLNFGKKDLSIWFKENEISLGELASLLAKIGYEPLLAEESEGKEKKKRLSQQTQLFIKLGVAGFCAGNIMLFSFPEYLGIEDGSLKNLFGYLNLVLGSVALFYSGSDYFKNIWAHLKLKKITIEMPILLGVMVGYSRSVYEILSHTGAGYMDSVSGLLFFLLVGKWFQQKSFDFLSFERKYTSYFPLVITKIIHGNEETAPLSEIKVGDCLRIRNEEIIPADAILMKGKSNMDYSFVTGESEWVPIQSGNLIYAGGRHHGEMIEIEVKKDLQQSHLTQLWEQQAFKDPSFKMENWENFANQVGVYFTIGLITLATVVAAYWIQADPSKWQNSVVSILVIACPCALAISYPFALGHGVRWLSKFHLYVKDIQALERMGQVDTLVFDKTGTLTLAKSEAPKNQLNRHISEQELDLLYSLSVQSTHPLSRRLCAYMQSLGNRNLINLSSFKEIPGKGLEAKWGDLTIKLGSAKFLDINYHSPQDFYSSESQLFIQIGEESLGYLDFPWENRDGVEYMLRKLQHHYDVYLVSGDKASHATSLKDWFSEEGHMKFECSPMDKMEFIRELQSQGKKVMMIGDGLNDAGALQQAHVGIAVSDDHLHFTPASDAILQGRSLSRLPEFLQFSQKAITLIKMSFLLSLVYNAIGLSFAVQGNLSPLVAAILMPVNSISMLIIATWGMNIYGRQIKNKLKSYTVHNLAEENHILSPDIKRTLQSSMEY
ncbi:Cu(+) exporting ATPase [Aquirufa nivalisilvae]|uniref:Cu(+) exporting ATPase n=1 Tax=Aquirufa nivalisilvae TaxID=2516557 RepID=A0A2S2DWJ5_9BACT|nr:heavy metal translocating P-type ATPase metal-binding domain-containing protein [Aquirufa nivalisilvae]AWL09400.1 Cu(+) exporting ATPase [Aquirufa nivalisilvae]